MSNVIVSKKIEHVSGYTWISAKELIRAEKGAELVYRGNVIIINKELGYVASQTDENKIYEVTDLHCDCEFYKSTYAICKHMFAFRFAKENQNLK